MPSIRARFAIVTEPGDEHVDTQPAEAKDPEPIFRVGELPAGVYEIRELLGQVNQQVQSYISTKIVVSAVTGGLMVIGYVAIYQVVLRGLGAVAPDLVDLVLGVLFFVTLLAGMATGRVLERVGVSIDGNDTRQVTLLAVDGLTVAILGSLTWAAVSSVIWPLVAVITGAVAATAIVLAIAGRWLDEWRMERSLALFGTVTGTVASGLALVALTDPDLESPVTAELGAMVVVSAPVVVGGIALATATASGSIPEVVATALFLAVGVLSLGTLALVMHRVQESSATISEK